MSRQARYCQGSVPFSLWAAIPRLALSSAVLNRGSGVRTQPTAQAVGKRTGNHRNPGRGERRVDSTGCGGSRAHRHRGNSHSTTTGVPRFYRRCRGFLFALHPYPRLAPWAGIWSPLPRLHSEGGKLGGGSTRRGRETFASAIVHLDEPMTRKTPDPILFGTAYGC